MIESGDFELGDFELGDFTLGNFELGDFECFARASRSASSEARVAVSSPGRTESSNGLS